MSDIRTPSRRGIWRPLLWLSLTLGACQAAAPAASPPPGDPGSPSAAPADGGAAASALAAPPFEDVAAASGLDFSHVNGMAGDLSIVEVMGAGGALFDYDNDGDLDAYLVQGHPLPKVADVPGVSIPAPPPDAPLDRLFRNDLETSADGSPRVRFTDVTDASGIRAPGYGMGVAAGDYDNDGWTDLYVTNWGPNQLWHNNGDGTFTDVTAASGADDPRWTTSAAWLDYDRDGWLDLMLVNYLDFTYARHRACFRAGLQRADYCGPESFNGEPSRLLRNRGDGTFEDVTLATGIAAAYGKGLGVVAADVNLDGWPDLYVANDTDENLLWINQAGQRFVNEARVRGVAVNRDGAAEGSMGLLASDLTGDGFDDLFVTNFTDETNTLYVGDATGMFVDQSRESGLGLPSLTFTGFGVADADFDLDGNLDVAVANGAVIIVPEQEAAGEPLPLKQTNQLFRNLGDGRFADVSAAAGSPFTAFGVGRGIAAGDVDNDGDTDLLVTDNNGPARLLLGTAQGKAWIGLRLVGGVPARDQIGSRVEIAPAGGAPPRLRRSHTDGSYLSAGDPRVLVGLADDFGPQDVRVTWPTGEVETWQGIEAGKYHTLEMGRGQAVRP